MCVGDRADHRAGQLSQLVRGGSLLHMAVQRHDLEMVRLLLRYGAQQQCRDMNGDTAIQLAESSKYADYDIFCELVLAAQVKYGRSTWLRWVGRGQ